LHLQHFFSRAREPATPVQPKPLILAALISFQAALFGPPHLLVIDAVKIAKKEVQNKTKSFIQPIFAIALLSY
jgi:hypothetical protein